MDKILITVVLLSACLTIGFASLVGDTCTSDSHCSSTGQYCLMYSGCEQGSCKCKSGYQTPMDSRVCKLTKLIGDSCDANLLCPEGSTCSSNSTCTCNANTRSSANKKHCVSTAYRMIGETCTTTQTCIEAPYTEGSSNANCENGRCVCTNGRKAMDQRCILYDYGESCTTSGTKTCNANKAYTCTESTCQCVANHIYYATQAECIFTSASKDVKEGESCNEDSNTSSAKWCASGLTCTTCGSESVKQCRKESSAATISVSVIALAAVLTSVLL